MPDTPNIGWKYTFEYYRGMDFKYLSTDDHISDRDKDTSLANTERLFDTRNHELFALRLEQYTPFQATELSCGFALATTYPGLLAGSGYQHEVKVEGELKLGFSFDHTTGLPIIPGSTIKGVLRSKWPVKNAEDNMEERKPFREFILWMMEEVNKLIEKPAKTAAENELTRDVQKIDLSRFNVETAAIDHLELEIFEGVDIHSTAINATNALKSPKFKKDWVFLKASAKDVFYDAAIAGGHGKFLGNDYITPHINRDRPELSPFTNPVPLQFLKVMPDVPFRFSFDLKDSPSDMLTKGQKLLLFRQIILTLGLGAKTNVGYGQFAEKKTEQDSPSQKIGNATAGTKTSSGEGNGNNHHTKVPMHVQTKMKKDSEWTGTVIDDNGKKWIISILVDKQEVILQKAKERCPQGLTLNSMVQIKFNADYVDPPNFKVLS